MEKQEHTTKPDQRVRLKSDGQDAMYPLAGAGSEGWVRQQQIDNHGYPMIYIEWDKDHWTYNGEPDRWTFEAHFDPVEEEMTDEIDDKELAEFREFQAFKRMKAKDAEPEASSEPETFDPSRLTQEQYAAVTAQVPEMLADADAFVLIVIDKGSREGSSLPVFTPAAITAYRSPESGMIAELQLAKIASIAFEHLTVDAIKRAAENES